MSEYQNHVRQSLDGQSLDPDTPGPDTPGAMRWSPELVGEDAPVETPESVRDEAHATLEYATDAYASLVNTVLGDGTHHLVIGANTPRGELTEGQELTAIGDLLLVNEVESIRICAALAAAMVRGGTGGLVVRTYALDGSEFVRGWVVRNSWLRPLTAREIRQAYTASSETGESLDPEPGVEYRQAERVPRLSQTQTGGASASTAPQDNRPPNRRN